MSKYRDRYGNPTTYALLGRNLTGEELATLAGSQREYRGGTGV